jgi:hypothetical protein
MGTSCSCDACLGTGPPSVRAGVQASRMNASGDSIQVRWDAASCPAAGYNLLYGNLADVAAATLNGAACTLGTSGSAVWSSVPPGNLFFLLVGTDGAATESSWGVTSSGQERHGASPSGRCGIGAKDATSTCP